MPWDTTELWTADVGPDGRLGPPTLAAGGGGESIFQPGWSPDGTLYFVSDRTGWWNLHRVRAGQVEAVHPMAAELGRPQWVFGSSTWAFADESRIISAYLEDGTWRIASLDVGSGALVPIDVDLEPGDNLVATATHAVFVGSSRRAPDAVVRITLATGAVETVRVGSTLTIDPGYISIAEAFQFPTADGQTAHAFYYPPCNRDFTPPAAERPPLIVVSHGGPTAMHRPALSLDVQYWTSRGFAVVGVNYGGSTGYGRAYRQRLNGQWGVVDVADCVSAADHLVARGQRRCGPPDHSRQQRRWVHDAGRAGIPPRRVQGGRELLRNQRSRGDDARHPQIRVAVSRSTRRSVPGQRARSIARDPRFISWIGSRVR